jgi:hypothetical protein
MPMTSVDQQVLLASFLKSPPRRVCPLPHGCRAADHGGHEVAVHGFPAAVAHQAREAVATRQAEEVT